MAALCFGLIDVPSPPAPESRPTVFADLGEGRRAEVLRHTWLWLLIGQALLYHLFFGGVLGVLGPIVVSADLGRAAWGWALAALMAGFIAGGLVSLHWRPRHGLYAGTALLSLTAALPAGDGALGPAGRAAVRRFLHGFGLELFSVNWDLSIQQNIAEDKLARVYSFDLVGSFVARPLGLALTGPIAAVGRLRPVAGGRRGGDGRLVAARPAVTHVRHLERHPAVQDEVPPADGAGDRLRRPGDIAPRRLCWWSHRSDRARGPRPSASKPGTGRPSPTPTSQRRGPRLASGRPRRRYDPRARPVR